MNESEACTQLLLRLDSDTLDSGPLRRGAGTLVGAAALVAAPSHPLGLTKALSTPGDGSESGVQWPVVAGGDVNQEIELWFYPRSWPSSNRAICGVDYNMELELGAGGRLLFNAWDNANGAAQDFVDGALTLNTWHHIRYAVDILPWALNRPIRSVHVDGKCVARRIGALPAASRLRDVGPGTFRIGTWSRASGMNSDALVAQAAYRRGYAGRQFGYALPTAENPDGATWDVMLHHFNGDTTDTGSYPQSLNLSGAFLSTQGRFGGSLDCGPDRYAYKSNNPTFDLGSLNWALHVWIYPRRFTAGEFHGVVGKRSSNTAGVSFGLFIWGETGVPVFEATSDGSTKFDVFGPPVRTNAWNHIVVARSGSKLQMFVNQEASHPTEIGSSAVIYNSSAALTIGRLSEGLSANYFDGLIEELRLEIHSPDVVDASPAPSTTPLPTIDPSPITVSRPLTLAQAALPVTVLKRLAAPLLLGDYWRGGKGRIVGTVVVDIDSTPVDPPLRRRVLLVREDTGETVRQTWSDATTGAYEFTDLDMRAKYTVVAHDYQGNYRAAIASGLTPTPMF